MKILKYLIALMLFATPFLQGQHFLSIAAIFQDEARFLDEWINYHYRIGVTHFRLYNNNSTDDYQSVLQPWIDRGVVELIQWPHKPKDNDWRQFSFTVQTGAYTNAINALKHETKWLALIDTDEFITATSRKGIKKALDMFPKKASVYVRWCMFGTNDVWDCKCNLRGLMTRHAPLKSEANGWCKSIVKPKYVTHCPNPHFCLPADNLYNTNFKKVHPTKPSDVTWNLLRLNHYWSRDEKFFQEVKIPRHEKWGGKKEHLRNRERGMR